MTLKWFPDIFFMVSQSERIIDANKTIYNITYPAASNSATLWEKQMPWIAVLVVGILTIGGNILINYYLRKSNKSILLEQLTHNKEIALEQIRNSQKNAQKEFDKTVLSGNRQILINQIRENLSSILTKASIAYLKQDLKTEDYDDLKLLITKVELLLNPIDDISLLTTLKSFDSTCFDIISSGKDISNLKDEIESLKVKTLEKLQSDWTKMVSGI